MTRPLGALSSAIILPEQLFTTPRMQPPPEQRLLIAILEDAINCFLGHDQRRSREAEGWIMAERPSRPFSFEHICAVLGLDSSAVRRTLRRRLSRKRAESDQQAATPVAG